VIVVVLPMFVAAQTSSYTGTASGNWSTGPWSAGVPNAAGAVADFPGGTFSGGYIAASVTVTQDVGAGVSLSGINFSNISNAFGYTVGGANGITFVDPPSSFGATISVTANTNLNSNVISAPITLNTNLSITSATNNISGLSISSAISSAGSSSITIATSAPHDETGQVSLSSGSSSFSGGVTLNSGNLQIAASSTGGPGSVTSGPLGTGTLTINGGVLVTNPALTFSNTVNVGTVFTIANSITANANVTYAGFSGSTSNGTTGTIQPFTLSGVISGAGGVVNRSRGGLLALTNADTYTGATLATNEPTPLVNTNPLVGTISFTGASGSALNSSSFTAQAGGTILLDNSGVGAGIARIGSGAPVTVNNGTFRINGSTGTTGFFTQGAGTLTAGGFGTVIVNPNSGTSEGVTLNFNNLSRGPGSQNGSFLFNGGTSSFGTAAAGVGVGQLTFTSAPALVGSGVLSSTSAPIIPYAIGTAANATGTGTDLVTYDTNGVRLLNANEYAASNSSLTAGQNNKLTAAGATITTNSNLSVQSLVISPASGNDTFSGTGTLTVSAGTIVSTSSGNNIINNNLNFGTAEGVVFVTSSLANNINISGVISGSGGLTKTGPGVINMLLGATGPSTPNVYGNAYTGQTTLAGGLAVINDQRVFGPDSSAIQMWGANSGNNAGIQNTTGGLAMTLSRNLVLNDGFIALDGNQSRTALLATGNISGAGGIYIANNSNGGMTWLSGTNTQTGETRINSGVLVVGSDNNLGAGPLDIGTNITAANPPLGLRLAGTLTTSRLINFSSSSVIDTGSFTATLNGPITDFGTDFVVKFGSGTLSMTNAQNGMVALILDNGTVRLSGAAHLINATLGGMAINSGKLQLDYSTSTAPKLSSSQNVQFGAAPSGIANGGGGTLELDAGGNTVTQQIGTITIPLSSSSTVPPSVASIRLSSGGGSGSVTLQAGTLNYSNNTASLNSMLFVAGDNLGTTTKLLVNNFQVNGAGSGSANALVGGAYAGNVGTPTLGILRGGYGDNAATGNGTDLITYDSSTGGGVRLLASTEYVSNSTGTANTNVKISSNTSTTTAADTINALVIQNASTLTTSGTLTIGSSTILSTGTGPNVIQGTGTNGGGGTLVAGNTVAATASGFNFAVATDLTVKTVLTGTNGTLIKMGPGTLTFDPLNASGVSVTTSALNGFAVFGGTLAVSDTAVTTPSVLGTGPFSLANGATFSYAGSGVAPAASRNINLYGAGGTLDLPGTFWQTATANVIAGSGALTLTGGTLVLGQNSTEANTFQGGTNLMTGSMLLINASSANTLGVGPLNLMGGKLGVRSASRTISANETAVFADTTFVNQQALSGPNGSSLAVDTQLGLGLTFSAPVRLENSVTLTNAMLSGALAGGGNVAGGGMVTFSGSIYDNPFKSPATLTLASTGSPGGYTFSIANSYRGGTVLNSGTLQVTNAYGSGTGNGTVTVNGSGNSNPSILSGTGYLLPTTGTEAGNTVTINSGGILAPGNTVAATQVPGTLTVGSPVVPGTTTGTVHEANGSVFRFLYAGVPAGAVPDSGGSATSGSSTGNNLILVNGNLILDGSAKFQIVGNENDFSQLNNYSFLVGSATTINGTNTTNSYDITYANNPTLFDTSLFQNFDPNKFMMEVHNVGNLEYFNLTSPVPEPSTLLLVGGAAGVFGMIRRRRQRRTK
jgi:hypothetical protein